MARAMVLFERQRGGSGLPATVILATPERLVGKCLPGDPDRDGQLARLLEHALPPRSTEFTEEAGRLEDWIGWAVNKLANGHTTWTSECTPALTVEELFEREVLDVVRSRQSDDSPHGRRDEKPEGG